MKTIKRVPCPIKGSATDDVCKALNKVVPDIEQTHGTIDPDRPVGGSTAF